MYKKIGSQLKAAISTPEEKREYVLESVFWVPISNSTSRLAPELRSEKLDSSKASSVGDFASRPGPSSQPRS